jgi:hypothetical protein
MRASVRRPFARRQVLPQWHDLPGRGDHRFAKAIVLSRFSAGTALADHWLREFTPLAA